MFASVDNYITDTLPLKRAKVKGKEVFIDKNLPVNNVHREVFYLTVVFAFTNLIKIAFNITRSKISTEGSTTSNKINSVFLS